MRKQTLSRRKTLKKRRENQNDIYKIDNDLEPKNKKKEDENLVWTTNKYNKYYP